MTVKELKLILNKVTDDRIDVLVEVGRGKCTPRIRTVKTAILSKLPAYDKGTKNRTGKEYYLEIS